LQQESINRGENFFCRNAAARAMNRDSVRNQKYRRFDSRFGQCRLTAPLVRRRMLPNCGVFPRETFAADAPSAAGKGLAIKCESKITSPAIETSGRSATRTALALAIAAE